MNNFLIVFFGILIGIAITIPSVLLVVRKRSDLSRQESEISSQEIKIKLNNALQEISNEKESRLREVDFLKNERQKTEENLNKCQSVIEQYATEAARANATEKSVLEQLEIIRTERDSLRISLDKYQKENFDFKAALEYANKHVVDAEKTKEITLNEKQQQCNEIVESHRLSCDELINSHKDSYTREIKSSKETYNTELLSLKEQSEKREIENANMIIALKESHDRMEQSLRESHIKEVSSQKEAIDRLQLMLLKIEETMKSTFDETSTRALQDATEKLFEIAKNRFKEEQENSGKRAEIEKREIERLLEPVQKELGALERLNREMGEKQAESLGVFNTTIENLNRTNESLANALKKPAVRGSWGEGQLISILESSGWVQDKDFKAQDITSDNGEKLIADIVIRLPRGRNIVIDCKTPLDKYMLAMEAVSESDRDKLFKDHSRAVKNHAKDLQSKEYWSRYTGSPPYVILFLPYEGAYQMACEHDRSLLDELQKSRIILANPMTLMNLIHLATYVLNEERLQQNAEEVKKHGQELYERLGKVLELLGKHGRHIRLAAESYNDILASTTGRLIPSATRMKALGAGTSSILIEAETVDTTIRQILSTDLFDESKSLDAPGLE